MNEQLTSGIEPITEMRFLADTLDKIIVGWDSKSNKFYSLRDFIGSRAAETAKRFGSTPSDVSVKRVTELTPEELQQTVVERLRRVSKGLRVAIGSQDFSMNELIQEVESSSQIGNFVLQANKSHIDLIEGLAEEGKLYPGQPLKGSIRPPLFDSM